MKILILNLKVFGMNPDSGLSMTPVIIELDPAPEATV